MADLHVANVDDEVLQEFKQFVLAKYGKLKGALSIEVTEALRFYLEHHKDEKLERFKKHLEKPKKKHIKLLLWLYKFPDEIIPDRVIRNYIMTGLGIVSKPTIRDYFNFAMAFLAEEHVDRSTKPVTVYYSIRKDEIKRFLMRHGIKVEEKEEEAKNLFVSQFRVQQCLGGILNV